MGEIGCPGRARSHLSSRPAAAPQTVTGSPEMMPQPLPLPLFWPQTTGPHFRQIISVLLNTTECPALEMWMGLCPRPMPTSLTENILGTAQLPRTGLLGVPHLVPPAPGEVSGFSAHCGPCWPLGMVMGAQPLLAPSHPSAQASTVCRARVLPGGGFPLIPGQSFSKGFKPRTFLLKQFPTDPMLTVAGCRGKMDPEAST